MDTIYIIVYTPWVLGNLITSRQLCICSSSRDLSLFVSSTPQAIIRDLVLLDYRLLWNLNMLILWNMICVFLLFTSMLLLCAVYLSTYCGTAVPRLKQISLWWSTSWFWFLHCARYCIRGSWVCILYFYILGKKHVFYNYNLLVLDNIKFWLHRGLKHIFKLFFCQKKFTLCVIFHMKCTFSECPLCFSYQLWHIQ